MLARPDLNGILASDLELAGLITDGPADAHVERERNRVAGALREGATAFVSDGSLLLFRPLRWDSEHFGCGAADLTRFYGNPAEPKHLIAHALEHAARAQIKFISARCQGNRPRQVQALENHGFHWVDTSVEVGKRVEDHAGLGDARLAVPEDLPALRSIAAEFRQNRFYFDSLIAREKARGVYEAWVESALRGNTERIFVAEAAGGIVGFVGYRRPEKDDPLCVATLTLIVITESERGKGAFGSLLRTVESMAARDGARWLRSSTQVHNTRSLRAFGRCGLLPYGSRHVFHRWAG